MVVPDDLDLEETNYGFPDIGDRLLNRPKLKSTKEGKKKKKSKGKKRRWGYIILQLLKQVVFRESSLDLVTRACNTAISFFRT